MWTFWSNFTMMHPGQKSPGQHIMRYQCTYKILSHSYHRLTIATGQHDNIMTKYFQELSGFGNTIVPKRHVLQHQHIQYILDTLGLFAYFIEVHFCVHAVVEDIHKSFAFVNILASIRESTLCRHEKVGTSDRFSRAKRSIMCGPTAHLDI